MNAPSVNPLAGGIRALAAVDLNKWLDALGVDRSDRGWLVFGLCAQALIVGCFIVHLVASRRRGKTVLPPSLAYVGMIAALMLLVYAAQRHDLVFMSGQFLNILICARLLVLIRRSQDRHRADESRGFPTVAPDSAERIIPRGEE